MKLSKCSGCMEPFQGYPCPVCGFDPQKATGMEYALPMESILAGKYLVGRVLGQGGFGITYIGWDLVLERKVAIKEYFPASQVSRTPGKSELTWYATDLARQARQDGMQMFLKEARKMSRVDGISNVVRVRDVFQENSTAYIVMDFVEGETLKARLKRMGPMPWEQAKRVFIPAIQAMEKVHQAGIIHRDLSPDNLMLTLDGNVLILDLGAAKDLNINSGASSMQVAKSGFSPLEQYTQRSGSGTWTDVYSMAATIYFTLTGKLPPNAVDRMEEDGISWNLPGLNTLPASGLEALREALTVSSKKRTQTMEELEAGLLGNRKRSYKEKRGKVWKRLGVIAAALTTVAVAVCVPLAWNSVLKPEIDYQKAQSLMEAGAYAEAGIAFELLGDYKDSAQKATDAGNADAYQQADALMREEAYEEAAAIFEELGNYEDSADKAESARKAGIVSIALSAGKNHTAVLCKNGTVVAVGENQYGQCNTKSWKNITAISAGGGHTVGLCEDGTVVAVGKNGEGQCDTDSWQGITAISAGGKHTVGICQDGTVVAVGENRSGQCDTGHWRDIVAISAGENHSVGLRENGTVVAVGDNTYGECDTGDWKDIIAVSAGYAYTVGLRKDGTVVTVGSNTYGKCKVDHWTDIVEISTGTYHTVGLHADGTVVTMGSKGFGKRETGDWTDIVAISAGCNHTIGLRKDGTVVAVGANGKGQCDIADWYKN